MLRPNLLSHSPELRCPSSRTGASSARPGVSRWITLGALTSICTLASLGAVDSAHAQPGPASPDGEAPAADDGPAEETPANEEEAPSGEPEMWDDEAPAGEASESAPASEEAGVGAEGSAPAPKPVSQDVEVHGRDLSKIAGSAHKIDKKELERFEQDDAHAILQKVPGVYVRGEDGYGLRPNIGFRGANSDRSKKLTLMEDGILFGPAPYSAPAAYYFPLMTRMVGVEVFKGPTATRFGPNTIGGAIDLRTRPITDGGGEIDLAYGQFGYGKVHGHYSLKNDRFGVLLEGIHLESSGFKDLDVDSGTSKGNTGFSKNEFMGKFIALGSPSAAAPQELEIKLGYSDETSNETYLGLSDADFGSSPYRRYAASQNDQMVYSRTQIAVTHRVEFSPQMKLSTTAYRHDFHRAWTKLNRFGERGVDTFGNPNARTSGDLSAILDSPEGRRRVFYDVLRGTEDSASSAETLMVGTNDRSYVSEGVQLLAHWQFGDDRAFLRQKIEWGLRYHHDEIQRLHTENGFNMLSGALVSDDGPTLVSTRNEGQAQAVAAHFSDEIALGNLLVSPGVRAELIHTEFTDSTPESTNGVPRSGGDSTAVFVPGLGIYYGITAELGVLAGAHRGFSPVAPGRHLLTPAANPRPERSTNYEAGGRWTHRRSVAELIGFFNDYENLTALCAFSGGCADSSLDDQTDAGRARILGLEASAKHDIRTGTAYKLPIRGAYTLTQTELLDSFDSENPQLGQVEAGDELPYVPQHQLSLSGGAESPRAGAFLSFTYVSEMREVAGSGPLGSGVGTDPQAVVDMAASYRPFAPESELSGAQVYLKVDNVLNQTYVASRRPFGARPGRPRLFYVGLKYRL